MTTTQTPETQTTEWIDVRAVMLRQGDVTPAGRIAAIEIFGEILRVSFEVEDGRSFTRTFDDLVSVQRPCPRCAAGRACWGHALGASVEAVYGAAVR